MNDISYEIGQELQWLYNEVKRLRETLSLIQNRDDCYCEPIGGGPVVDVCTHCLAKGALDD